MRSAGRLISAVEMAVNTSSKPTRLASAARVSSSRSLRFSSLFIEPSSVGHVEYAEHSHHADLTHSSISGYSAATGCAVSIGIPPVAVVTAPRL